MPDYKWNCLVCENGNAEGDDFCSFCGCISSPSQNMIDVWQNQGLGKPSLDPKSLALWGEMGMLNVLTYPCPNCRMHVYICSSNCWNCAKIYNPEERYLLVRNLRSQRSKTQFYGLIFFSTIVLITLIL